MTSAAILRTAQSLNPGGIVSLFELDTRKIGGPLLYFVQGTDVDEELTYGGTTYVPIDCEFEGLETTGQGALPTPVIRLANTDGIAQTAVNTFGDLVDCQLTRIRTFVRHLDGNDDPDPNAFLGPDVFRIERKTSENNVFIEWELSASIDQEGKQMPGRHVIRDTCLAPYRIWNEVRGDFDYDMREDGMCPYEGNNYFDEFDRPKVDPRDDKPSRTQNCCKKRFGKNQPLFFWGFPGVGRAR
jgi:lambda family phage minor tail protein L